jgi:hypothetical protein
VVVIRRLLRALDEISGDPVCLLFAVLAANPPPFPVWLIP